MNIIKIILNIIIIGLIIFLCANLFVFLLPFILVIVLAYFLYSIFVFQKRKNNSSMHKTSSRKTIKNNVEEAEVIKEEFDK